MREFHDEVKDSIWDFLLCIATLLGVAAIANWLAKAGSAVGQAVQRGGAWTTDNLDLSSLGKLIAGLLLKNSNAASIMVQIGAVLAICLTRLASDILFAQRVRTAKEAEAWNDYHRKVRHLQKTAGGCEPTHEPIAGEAACVLASL